MDKEKIITIALGLLVGVVLASLYFGAVKFLPQLFPPSPKVTYNPAPAKQDSSVQIKLSVSDPQDETTTKESPLNFTGKANPGDKIMIFAPAEEKIASADAAGNFSGTIKLEDGENEISFSLLSSDGVVETTTRNVILEISQ